MTRIDVGLRHRVRRRAVDGARRERLPFAGVHTDPSDFGSVTVTAASVTLPVLVATIV